MFSFINFIYFMECVCVHGVLLYKVRQRNGVFAPYISRRIKTKIWVGGHHINNQAHHLHEVDLFNKFLVFWQFSAQNCTSPTHHWLSVDYVTSSLLLRKKLHSSFQRGTKRATSHATFFIYIHLLIALVTVTTTRKKHDFTKTLEIFVSFHFFPNLQSYRILNKPPAPQTNPSK